MGGTIATGHMRVAIAAAVLSLVAGNVLAFRSVTNRARPVPIRTVIARFRSHAAIDSPVAAAASGATSTQPIVAAQPAPAAQSATTLGSGLPSAQAPATVGSLSAPTPGVYVYVTSGHEDADAFGGVHHAYPDQTTITVTPAPCGLTMRWDALQQRWDEWTACVTGRQFLVRGERMKHSFYGINDERDYGCSAAGFRPGGEAAGTPVGGHCSGSGDESAWSGQVIGPDTVMVGGQAVPAIHVLIQEQVTGDTDGIRRSDNWFALDSALLLKRVASVDGTSGSPVGRVHYTETVTLHLTSLTPSR